MNKELRFTAPLVRFKILKPGDANSEDIKPRYEVQPRCHPFVLGLEAPLWQGLVCIIDLDSGAYFASLESDGFLLLLRRSYLTTNYNGLVVRAVEEKIGREGFQNVKSYQRIGVFDVFDQWQRRQELPDLKEWAVKVVLVRELYLLIETGSELDFLASASLMGVWFTDLANQWERLTGTHNKASAAEWADGRLFIQSQAFGDFQICSLVGL